MPHQSTPGAIELGHGPEAHAASPSVGADPTAHAATPEAVALQLGMRHASSPSLEHEAAAHAASPQGTELEGAPLPHPGAPDASVEGAATGSGLSDGAAARKSSALAHRSEHPFRDGLEGVALLFRAAIGLSPASTHVDTWGRDTALSDSLRPLFDTLYSRYFRVTVEGQANVPPGPCLIVANHAGALPLDGPILHHALQRERPDLAESRWLVEDQVIHAPVLGLLASRLGAVRASPDNALALLAEQRPVIVFPEGFEGLAKPFSERYQLRRFGRGGVVKLAVRARVPIIPVAIVGGEEATPLLGKLPGGLFGLEYLPVTVPPLPARWRIRFGAPIDFSRAPHGADTDLPWVHRINEDLKETVRGMLDELLDARKSVFR